MFTGIVTDLGEVTEVEARSGDLRRLVISCSYRRDGIALGASIACSGVCMTVIETGERGQTWFAVEAAAETLAITTVGRWQRGTKVNLERSLKLGDELGGHMVAGHVDGIAKVASREDTTEAASLTFRAPDALSRFIAAKGSVALDGVSLTVNSSDKQQFSVMIIPHTLKVTTFGSLRAGDGVNLEIDTMARYAARLLESR